MTKAVAQRFMTVEAVKELKNREIITKIDVLFTALRNDFKTDATKRHVTLGDSIHRLSQRSGVKKSALVSMYDQLLDLYHIARKGIEVPHSSADWKAALTSEPTTPAAESEPPSAALVWEPTTPAAAAEQSSQSSEDDAPFWDSEKLLTTTKKETSKSWKEMWECQKGSKTYRVLKSMYLKKGEIKCKKQFSLSLDEWALFGAVK